MTFASWIYVQFAISTYIAGIFKTIPKLIFHLPTENRLDNNCKPTKFIPAYRSVLLLYWTYIIIFGVIILVLSCLRGYFMQIQDERSFKICQGCLLITLSIANVACNLCLIKYGRLLVVLTQETVNMMSGGENFKAYLKKLKIINFALMVIVSWSSISFLLWAVGSFSIRMKTNYPIIMSFITNIGYAVMIMAAIFGIIRGEFYPKYVNNEMSSTNTISNVRWSQTSIEQD
ncbi:hypothetical protein C1645_784004 [Glomus cerebriforme]|uniref:Uncharacterized protein n=1 Tax=Glomus cerebriforme TaxID=658196 RepID=A0A397SNS3_9GLOM|nr:hypothetical protein C1645_784004 [Glomus cerebriforme]